MNWKNLLKPITYPMYFHTATERLSRLSGDAKVSYSQTGEDLIVHSVLRHLAIERPTYLDIGANDPVFLSNTYRLYRQGFRGVCVEPNPKLASVFKRKRPRDEMLEVAVGSTAGTAVLHVVSDPLLSTISLPQAEVFATTSKHHITQEVEVPVVPFMDLVRDHFDAAPDLVSLDTEGTDLEILESIDFTRCRPLIFCVETLSYDEHGHSHKIAEIGEHMEANGYFVFGDTYLNTIFVDRTVWQERMKARFEKSE